MQAPFQLSVVLNLLLYIWNIAGWFSAGKSASAWLCRWSAKSIRWHPQGLCFQIAVQESRLLLPCREWCYIQPVCCICLFMPSPPNTVGEDVNVFGLSVRRVLSFVQTDIITTTCHDRLEQFWWNWQAIFASPNWWLD